jgi:serine/threonine protein phosphatase 1
MRTFVIGDVHGRSAQMESLIGMIPRDEATDTLIFLGDLIDRGPDAPGVVERVSSMCRNDPERVRCLRGNHEQMLLDFISDGAGLWLTQATGGEETFEQYTGQRAVIESIEDFDSARENIRQRLPASHLEFLNNRPLFFEDKFALYVHAGLDSGRHPEETDARFLLWARDLDFFKHYKGKPCIFGHTPTMFLPLLGRIGRHGIYISHSAVGIDTGYNYNSPLSCLSLPDFVVYQSFANGHTATHHITSFLPEELREMQRAATERDLMVEN